MASFSSIELSELLSRVRNRDESAATELVKQYGPEVRREIRCYLRSQRLKTREDSRDVMQSVMRSLFLRLDRDDEVVTATRLLNLLRAMAKNKAIDAIRRNQAMKCDIRRTVRLPGDIPASQPDDPSPSKVLGHKELLEKCLNYLPEQHRKLFTLKLMDKTDQEIARILKKTVNAVRKQYARVKKLLRAAFPSVSFG